MAATDYVIVESALARKIYLAKKIKSKNLMSSDRREVTDNEILGMFENYLRRYCEEHHTDTVEITKGGGTKIFTATLIDKEK